MLVEVLPPAPRDDPPGAAPVEAVELEPVVLLRVVVEGMPSALAAKSLKSYTIMKS